ncbi:DUF317 domain-containing protein [Kitasatospora griseola]|uniref:DUF317 domain-containing protein n=1 Tax=Kitasatospora griseola TaxID=2064 RepID=UPI00382242A6
MTSPCRTAVLTSDGPMGHPVAWTVHGYTRPGSEPLWRASFSSGTPAEITAAFTTALADGLRTRHRAHPHDGTAASLLFDRGWRPSDRAPRGFHDQVAPDGTAVYRHLLGHQPHNTEVAGLVPPTWTMLAGHPQRPSWRAEFTISVPFHPLAQAALAFSSAAPVHRRPDEVPARHLALVTLLRQPASSRPTGSPRPAETGRPHHSLLRPAPAVRSR